MAGAEEERNGTSQRQGQAGHRWVELNSSGLVIDLLVQQHRHTASLIPHHLPCSRAVRVVGGQHRHQQAAHKGAQVAGAADHLRRTWVGWVIKKSQESNPRGSTATLPDYKCNPLHLHVIAEHKPQHFKAHRNTTAQHRHRHIHLTGRTSPNMSTNEARGTKMRR